jgi:hypothetical protein
MDLEHWLEDDNHIYIGRSMGWVKGAKKSIWANKFSVKDYGRKEALRLYKEDIVKDKKLMMKLPELRGKVLGCWCRPDKCHGDVLIELLDELDESNAQEGGKKNNSTKKRALAPISSSSDASSDAYSDASSDASSDADYSSHKTVKELISICKKKRIRGYSGKRKAEILDMLLDA